MVPWWAARAPRPDRAATGKPDRRPAPKAKGPRGTLAKVIPDLLYATCAGCMCGSAFFLTIRPSAPYPLSAIEAIF